MILNKNKKKKDLPFKSSKAAVAFYVLAILFIVYGAYMIFTVYDYLLDYYASYSVGMWDNASNTLQYFVSNCSSYFVYAILCYGIGMILHLLNDMKVTYLKAKNDEVKDDEAEEEMVIEYHAEEKV